MNRFQNLPWNSKDKNKIIQNETYYLSERKISVFTWTFPLLSFAYIKTKNKNRSLWQPEYLDNMFIHFSSILCLWSFLQLGVNESLEGNNEWI